MKVRQVLAASAVTLGLSVAAAPAMAEGISVKETTGDEIQAGIGVFNVLETANEDTSVGVNAEYRFGQRWNGLGPMVGLVANSDGGVMGYAGGYLDVVLGGGFQVTPFYGVGLYSDGSGPDLGGALEFRGGIDLTYGYDFGRMGLKLAHTSNAGIHDENPGTEEVLVVYQMPFGT